MTSILRTSILQHFLTALVAMSCIDPYPAPDTGSETGYLVVDGFLDSGKGAGTVTLTRTVGLNDSTVPAETGAVVSIEVKDATAYPLTEQTDGVYYASGLSLSTSDQCRLHIITGGIEYFSDYVQVKQTPAIDSITWDAGTSALTISVTTHDPGNSSHFYRWRYEETAQYRSAYQSNLYYDPLTDEVIYRFLSDTLDIYNCWKTIASTSILVATSESLEEDVISKFPVVALESTSWKHKIKYSILVKQYVIDENEYDYWTQLKKNTESIGTIFDPQPSQSIGNLYSSSAPGEPVLGYFSVSSEMEQRIFISRSELPYTDHLSPYDACYYGDVDTVLLEDFWEHPQQQLLITEYTSETGFLLGYTTATSGCIDCRIRLDGVNRKPDFWE